MMRKPESVSSSELSSALISLEGWNADEPDMGLRKEFVFRDFAEAFAFMTRVALVAERLNHHPDWSNSFNRVKVTLLTHSAKAITTRDIELAHQIEDASHTEPRRKKSESN